MGIGFVQSIGDGMTGADMPNAGSATYTATGSPSLFRERVTIRGRWSTVLPC